MKPPSPNPPPNTSLTILDPTQDASWEKWITHHPSAGFFHSTAWARVLKDTYGHQPLYLRTADSGPPAGLPLMEVKGLRGKRGVSLPFTDECEPLANPGQERAILEGALALGRERHWNYFLCHGAGTTFNETTEASRCPPTYFSHSINLQPAGGALFDGFRETTRRSIRKAEKAKVTVEIHHSLEALAAYYRLHCLTRQRHGVPPQPWAFFHNIHRHVLAPNLGFVVLARAGSRPAPVAGAVFFHFGRHATFKYGASDPSFQNLRPNNLVLWRAIQHLAGKSFIRLSLGRTSLGNEGLRRFKLAWNTTEESLCYLKYDYQQGRFLPETDDATGWHNAVFRKMPSSIARWLGGLLYRHWILLLAATLAIPLKNMGKS